MNKKENHRNTEHDERTHNAKENARALRFAENYMNCNILYRMRVDAQSNHSAERPFPQMPILQHTLANTSELQSLPRPLPCLDTTNKQTNAKTLFDTFNHSDFSRNEDEQYSNYLKEYQTLMKASRKKDHPSPQQHTQQINLLIHEFLSDISQPTTAHKQEEDKNSITKPKKVEKIQIDLNAFQIGKTNSKSPKKINKESSLEIRKKEVTPRFININELNAKAKINRETKQRSSSKKQIQVVKVTTFGGKPNNHQFQRHIQKVQIAKNPQKVKKTQKPVVVSRQQSSQGSSEFSYSKNREIRQRRSTSKPTERAHQKKEKEQAVDSVKKPIKIQIEIPLEQLKPHQPPRSPAKHDHLTQLDHESQEIIKDISHKVLSLLQRSKDMARQGK